MIGQVVQQLESFAAGASREGGRSGPQQISKPQPTPVGCGFSFYAEGKTKIKSNCDSNLAQSFTRYKKKKRAIAAAYLFVVAPTPTGSPKVIRSRPQR